MYYIVIIIIILCIIVKYTESLQNHDPEYVVYDSGVAGPVVGILAGIHGNEPAGSLEMQNLIKTGWFRCIKTGSVRIIPAANPSGLRWNTRYKNWKDMNRIFSDPITDRDATEILKFFETCDIVIDFHEGWGFHQINPDSLGSTIMCNSERSRSISGQLITDLNNSDTMRPIIANNKKKAWVVLNEARSCEIPTTLSCYYRQKKRDHILVETTGQNDIQPVNVRQQQVKIIVESLLKTLGNI